MIALWLAAVGWSGEVSGYALPTASFDTDDGFGVGGRVEVAWLEEGYTPYRTSMVLAAYVATSGFQDHRFRLDRVGIGRRRRGRVTLRVSWRQWLNDGYWGIGNGTTRERAYVGTFARDDPDRVWYRYRLFQPYAHLSVRHALDAVNAWQVFGAIGPKYSQVDPYEDSLLAEEAPFGLAGGVTVRGFAGVLHDTRWPEVAPTSGHLVEISGSYALDLGGEAGGFGGPLVSVRSYVGSGRLVFASRVMAEWLLGTVPFYEMVHWGGAIPVSGMGGAETVRGLSFGRIRAPGKAVVNLEPRIRVADLRAFKRPLGLEVAPFVDLGAVWGAVDPVPAALPVRPAAGLGGRLVFDETFVGRLDTGVGLDPIVEADGTVTEAMTWGFYLTFGHPF